MCVYSVSLNIYSAKRTRAFGRANTLLFRAFAIDSTSRVSAWSRRSRAPHLSISSQFVVTPACRECARRYARFGHRIYIYIYLYILIETHCAIGFVQHRAVQIHLFARTVRAWDVQSPTNTRHPRPNTVNFCLTQHTSKIVSHNINKKYKSEWC